MCGSAHSVTSSASTFSPGSAEFVPLVLTQAMRTLRAVLMTPSGFMAGRDATLWMQAQHTSRSIIVKETSERKLRRQVSTGSKVFSEENEAEVEKEILKREVEKLQYGRNKALCESLTKWLPCITEERRKPSLGYHRQRQNRFTGDDLPSSMDAMGPVNDLSGGYTSASNTLVTDALTCAKCAIHILLHDCGVESVKEGLGDRYQPLLEELVEAGGELVVVVLKELSGLTDPSRRVGTGDVRAAEGVYGEIQACLSFVASAFSAGMVTVNLKIAVEIGRSICIDCRSSLAVQSSWLQAVFCAVMCMMLTDQDEGQDAVGARILAVKMAQMKAKMNEDDEEAAAAEMMLSANDRFYVFLGKSIYDIMHVLNAHPNTSSIQHMGLLITRLLLRPPFLSKRDIGNVCDVCLRLATACALYWTM